jgi:hypothetical protein
MSIELRVALRFKQKHASMVRVLVDVPATVDARRKYPLFTDMIIGTFDQSAHLYRIFDGQELRHILSSGRITGGQFSIKAEREHGASWGWDISEIIAWGNGQRGKRLGSDLYLAKLDTLDKKFAHIEPGVQIDPEGPAEQPVAFNLTTCRTGIGCSVMDVGVDDVDFFEVSPDGRIHPVMLSDLKGKIKEAPVAGPVEEKEVRDPSWGLQPKMKVIVTKGSRDLGIQTRSPASVLDVWQRKGEREVLVKLFFPYPRKFPDGRWSRDNLTLYAIHPNRLNDPEVGLMNSRGDKILVRRK